MPFDGLNTSPAGLREAWRRAAALNNPERTGGLADAIVARGLDGRLGDDRWSFYEQAFFAALDVGKKALADTCYSRLERRFPSSARVRRLKGVQLESQGKYEDAHKVYRDILKEDETNILVTKRVICLAKAKGKTTEAIAALVKFLDVVYNDQEAWMELSDLYAKEHMCVRALTSRFPFWKSPHLPQTGIMGSRAVGVVALCRYQHAAYCMEELVLHQVHNPLYYLRLAEILYTMGQFGTALKTYCRVLELTTDHVRALYGLKLCARRLLALPPSQTGVPNTSVVEQLDLLATERLLRVYGGAAEGSDNSGKLRHVVRGWLEGK